MAKYENTMNANNNNIIAVASGKGGVGKTWFAITLAHLFARSARRVLLFDGDIGLANVDVQLGLTPEKDLGSVFSGKCKLRDILIHHHGGFDILAGRSGSTSLSGVSLNLLSQMKEELQRMAVDYDAVIIDLGAGIETYVQFMASIASQMVVVITDDPTSLTDAYAFIKLCATRLGLHNIAVVVNQAGSQKEGEKTYGALEKACANFLQVSPPLLGVIRKDNKVKDSIRAQMPLLEKSPHTLAATDAAAIAVKLIQKVA